MLLALRMDGHSMTIIYTVSRDGRTLATFTTHLAAFAYLLGLQGRSVEWATRHDGYAITTHHEKQVTA